MSNIQNAAVTIMVIGPAIEVGGTYLAETDNTISSGELEEITILKETELAYQIEQERYGTTWILKDRIINSGEMNRNHVYKIVERLPSP